MHRVLVTGASSALGMAVGRALHSRKHHVTGTIRNRRDEISLPMFNALLELNLEKPETFGTINGQFDAIIHVAAASYGSRETLMQVTGLATRHLAERAITLRIPNFIYVSSMSVFGVVREAVASSRTPIRHQTPYGAAKWAAENYLHQIHDRINCVCVRSPAIVGAQKNPHFLQRTRVLMEEGRPTIAASHPDFLFNNVIHEDTMAEFLVHLAVTSTERFRAFPVGSLQDVSLRELLSFMSDASSYKGRIVWSEEADPPFSISLDDALSLGFRPLTALESIRRWALAWNQFIK